MECCRICGEIKVKEQFKKIMFFAQYKKKRTFWCQECQKFFIAMKKEKEAEEKLKTLPINYLVLFQ